MRRATRSILALALLVAVVVPASLASADSTETFTACLAYAGGDTCETTATYLYGDKVILKGKVSPVHDSAKVLRKDPGADSWERVDTVTISDTGKMRWAWRTKLEDAQFDPYLLRFKIPGHGTSNKTQAFVVAGE